MNFRVGRCLYCRENSHKLIFTSDIHVSALAQTEDSKTPVCFFFFTVFAAQNLGESRLRSDRKRLRKGHVEWQPGRRGHSPVPVSPSFCLSHWAAHSPDSLKRASPFPACWGITWFQQLAQPQSSHLGQAAELPPQLNPLPASSPLPKDGICFPSTSGGMLASVLEPGASL